MVVNAQEWLYENYSMKNKKNFTKLDISRQNLEGKLDLRDFENLEELNCSNNPLLKSLDVSRLRKLEKLNIVDTNINVCGKHLVNVPLKELNGRSFSENYRKLWLEKTLEEGVLTANRKLTSRLQLELSNLLKKQAEVASATNKSIIKIQEKELEEIKRALRGSLGNEMIQNLCQIKDELTKLKIQDGQSTEEFSDIGQIDFRNFIS